MLESITKVKDSWNEYTWRGLTLGKLMAIEGALSHAPGTVAYDCRVEVLRAIAVEEARLKAAGQPS